MISTEGAALIAQVYPIGIVVIGLESRALPKVYATTRRAFAGLVTVGLLMGVAVWAGVQSTVICVRAVSGNVPVTGQDAAMVEFGGWMISNLATFLLIFALGETFGVWDRISSSRETWKSERRTSAMLERVQRLHPGAGRKTGG